MPLAYLWLIRFQEQFSILRILLWGCVTGLEKLLNTQEEVKVLQKDLTAMKPELEVAQKNAEVMLKSIEVDRVSLAGSTPSVHHSWGF